MTNQPPRSYTTLAIAIVVGALIIGAGVYVSSFAGTTTTITNTSTLTTSISTTSTASGTASPSSGTTETTTAQSFTTTIPFAQTYTNESVTLDPRLVVTPMRGLLETSTNATTIAEALASSFNQLPIQLTLHSPPTCTGTSTSCGEADFPYSTAVDLYIFKSSTGSNITVEFILGRFLELQYVVQDYNSLYNDYFNNYTAGMSNPSPSIASVTVGNLMLSAYGIDLSKVSLANIYAGEQWLRVDWTEQYRGMGIANSAEVYFEYYPPTSQVIRLIIVENSIEEQDLCCGYPLTLGMIGTFNAEQGGWYLIPQNFPLNISASAALNSAKEYGTNTLHMNNIVYASIDLQVIQDHLYYAATISDQSKTYYLFVNPITGEVGFPLSQE